jgi:Rieske Fe-S protein
MKRVCITTIIIAIIMGSIACSTSSIVPEIVVQTAIAQTEAVEKTVIASTEQYRKTVIAQTRMFEDSVNTAVALTQVSIDQSQTPIPTPTYTPTATSTPTRQPVYILPSDTPIPPAPIHPTPIPPAPKGGNADINGWCQHLGYSKAVLIDNAAGGWRCQAVDGSQNHISVQDACNWQYGGGGSAQSTNEYPYWVCVFP